MNATSPPRSKPERLLTFSRVLVGVDRSAESREAARQAAILTEVDGRLTLLAVYDVAPAIVGGTGTPAYFDEDWVRGMLAGLTATELIHRAPCSVLVAREAGAEFPSRIVVGVDGSPESAAAYATARHLAERFDAELSPVVAYGGKGVDGGWSP